MQLHLERVDACITSKSNFSFAELESQDDVPASNIITALNEYAATGAAILASVVNSIVNRSALSDSELWDLTAAALRGIRVQEQRANDRERNEYHQVLDHAQSLLKKEK